jgi:hypothetical protein
MTWTLEAIREVMRRQGWELPTGPLDDIDRQLIADEAADNAGEGWG